MIVLLKRIFISANGWTGPMSDLTRASLLTRVRRHAALTPHKVAVRVLDDDGSGARRA